MHHRGSKNVLSEGIAMLNPGVDFVFKKSFGSEENKDILMSFINSVVSAEDQVMDLTLRNPFSRKSYLQGKLVILALSQNVSGKNLELEKPAFTERK